MTPWRLLVTQPTDGATNMAIDEAVWRARKAEGGPHTLRFLPPLIVSEAEIDEALSRLGSLLSG